MTSSSQYEAFSKPPIESFSNKTETLADSRPTEDKVDNNNFSLCCQCKENKWKYKCPGCGTKTCSLECVNSHKKTTNCTGKRDRTSFLPLASFTDKQLISDYHFLEEALRERDSAKKLRTPLGAPFHYKLPPPMTALRSQAQNRGTTLLYLAKGMTRRLENSSEYHKRRRCIFWRVEWQLHSGNVKLVTRRMDENETLGDVLQKQLLAEVANGSHGIGPYIEAGMGQLRLFFKKEPAQANNTTFYEFQASETLKSQLSNMVLIEFPIVHVALPNEFELFPICEREVPIQISPSKLKGEVEGGVEGEKVVQAENSVKMENLISESSLRKDVEGKWFREETIKDSQ